MRFSSLKLFPQWFTDITRLGGFEDAYPTFMPADDPNLRIVLVENRSDPVGPKFELEIRTIMELDTEIAVFGFNNKLIELNYQKDEDFYIRVYKSVHVATV